MQKLEIHVSKSTSKPVTFSTPPSKNYNTEADFTLVNGISAVYPRINSEWLAWQGEDVEITIDLGEKQKISSVKIGSLFEKDSWIVLPESIILYCSTDGKEFKHLDSKKYIYNGESPKMTLLFELKKKKTRYVKIKVKNPGVIPKDQPGAGNKSWIFFDEISID
jgi:hexosaminidase